MEQTINKIEKTALELYLPIKKGTKALFKQTDGQKAQSNVRKIKRLIYGKTSNCMFVTFETKNSIYKDVPFKIEDSPNYYDGWYIEQGMTVPSTTENIVVGEVIEITEDTVIILDSLGRKFKMPIKYVASE